MSRKKRKIYTDKKHAVKGIIATGMAALAFVLFGVIVFLSYKQRGQAQMWIGSVALFSILLSLVGLILGLMSFKGEDNYKLFSQLGSFCNVFVLVLWAMIYLIGF